MTQNIHKPMQNYCLSSKYDPTAFKPIPILNSTSNINSAFNMEIGLNMRLGEILFYIGELRQLI